MSISEISGKNPEEQGQYDKKAAELSSLPSFDEHMQIDYPETYSHSKIGEEIVPQVEVIDMTEARGGELMAEFPDGMYLFHSADVDSAKKILESGAIMNAGALHERNLAARRAELEAEGIGEDEIQEELKKVHTKRNSGNEGVSWSCNGISALAGDDGHIVGFLAAPVDVLGGDKLVVPSRPAPYELLQVSDEVDTERFFEAKKQYEVWGYREFAVFEIASVDNGLMRLRVNISHGDEPDEYGFHRSLLRDFCDRGGLPAEELRKHFEIGEDGHVKIDEQLHQQSFDEKYLPPSAVFIQSMIDRDMFKGSVCDGLDVNGIVAETRKRDNLMLFLIGHARKEGEYRESQYEAELRKARDVSVPVEQMYLVISPKDLEMWKNEIENFEHRPKGILLYDPERVVTPNFAQGKEGDHVALSEEIGNVVGVDMDFWKRDMGIDLDKAPRAGSQNQVLTENIATRLRKSEFKLVNGRLTKAGSK